MAIDSEGFSYTTSSPVYYDDGVSVDNNNVPIWSHGNVSGFNATNTAATIAPDGGGPAVTVMLPKIHVHEPNDPPDRN
jgi:hypothetical protein